MARAAANGEWQIGVVEHDDSSLLVRQGENRRGAVMLGALLLFVGVVMLLCSAFMVTGIIDAEYWYPDQGWRGPALTFFVIGMVACLPGTYSMRIVWHVYRGTPGYSLSQLPAPR